MTNKKYIKKKKRNTTKAIKWNMLAYIKIQKSIMV